MKIFNIHKRIINQPKSKIVEILKTLSTENDKIWPNENWPAMKFDNGIQIGAKGGHGPIRYHVEKYDPTDIIQFRFSKPIGFNGIHKFEIKELNEQSTEITHTIDMITEGKGTLIWIFAIRYLHNALLEDAFDKLENNFPNNIKFTKWNMWVRFVRNELKKRNKSIVVF